MNKRVIVLIILLIVLSSISVKANIMCNDGTYSPTCGDCHRGCCSHHGGCASNSSNYSQLESNYEETYKIINDVPDSNINDNDDDYKIEVSAKNKENKKEENDDTISKIIDYGFGAFVVYIICSMIKESKNK